MEEDSGLSGEAYNCSSPSSTSGLSLTVPRPHATQLAAMFSDPCSVNMDPDPGRQTGCSLHDSFIFFSKFESFVSKINFELVKGSKTFLSQQQSAFLKSLAIRLIH
jgi:hypothetical protein